MTQEIETRTTVFLGMTAIIASEPMRRLMERIERAARSSASVLITGESGSGKELVARAVHHFSPRSHRPWVDLSCAALPEHLLESELFGYDRGAFSGADTAKPGLFEMAHQGTLFLDEVGELDPQDASQAAARSGWRPVLPLGGDQEDHRRRARRRRYKSGSGAHGRRRPLPRRLYHRSCQLTLHVPPLRERVEDIAPLAWHILEQHDPAASFTVRALRLLESHTWPGNVRELRNVMMKAAVMNADLEIDAEHIPLAAPRVLSIDGSAAPAAFSNSLVAIGSAVSVGSGPSPVTARVWITWSGG